MLKLAGVFVEQVCETQDIQHNYHARAWLNKVLAAAQQEARLPDGVEIPEEEVNLLIFYRVS